MQILFTLSVAVCTPIGFPSGSVHMVQVEFSSQKSFLILEKEIGNFVDLAGSTLGEDDMAAQKTRYLLTAMTGYSPLIYDLHTMVDVDYKTFIEMCTKVWEAVRTSNNKLVTSLV